MVLLLIGFWIGLGTVCYLIESNRKRENQNQAWPSEERKELLMSIIEGPIQEKWDELKKLVGITPDQNVDKFEALIALEREFLLDLCNLPLTVNNVRLLEDHLERDSSPAQFLESPDVEAFPPADVLDNEKKFRDLIKQKKYPPDSQLQGIAALLGARYHHVYLSNIARTWLESGNPNFKDLKNEIRDADPDELNAIGLAMYASRLKK